MNKILFLTATLFFLFTKNEGEAQSLDIQLKSADKVELAEDANIYYLDAGAGQKLVIGFNEKRKEIQFTLFDPNMKLLKSNKISYKGKFDKNAYIHGSYFIKIKDKIYLSFVVEKGKQSSISLQELSIENLDFVGAPIMLLENVPENVKIAAQSPDGSKFVILTSLKPEGPKNKQKNEIGLYVFNDKLTKISDKTYSVPFEDYPNTYVLTNSGKVFSNRTVIDGKDLPTGLPNFHFEILSFDNGKDIVTKINVNDYYVYSYPNPTIVPNIDNSCSICFLAQKEKGGNMGAVYINIDPKKEVTFNIADYYSEVPEEIRMQNVKAKDGKVYALRFSDHYDCIPMADGSTKMVCVSKEPPHGFHQGMAYGNVVEEAVSFSGVYIMSFNKKSKLEWIKKISTNNIGFDDFTFCYSKTVISRGNDLLVFYNDDVKNKNLGPNETPVEYERTEKRRDEGHVFCTKVNATGNLENYDLGSILTQNNIAVGMDITPDELIGNDLIAFSYEQKILSHKVLSKATLTFYEFAIKDGK